MKLTKTSSHLAYAEKLLTALSTADRVLYILANGTLKHVLASGTTRKKLDAAEGVILVGVYTSQATATDICADIEYTYALS